jgi:hypothetical protein
MKSFNKSGDETIKVLYKTASIVVAIVLQAACGGDKEDTLTVLPEPDLMTGKE